jgi:hypothetical protein
VSFADLYEDGFPHGTKEGFERGCRGGACPNKFEEGATICRDAAMRYARDYAYRRAIDNGETPPPEFPDAVPKKKTTKASPNAEERVWAEPVVTVADTIAEPAPEQPAGSTALAFPRGKRGPAVFHGTKGGYQKGCRVDHQCPSFLGGGKSCRLAAMEYQRDRRAAISAKAERPAPRPATFADKVEEIVAKPEVEAAEVAPAKESEPDAQPPVAEMPAEVLLSALTSDPAVECSVTMMPSGGLVVVIRIPASVVAA